jgi:hypothetical protein
LIIFCATEAEEYGLGQSGGCVLVLSGADFTFQEQWSVSVTRIDLLFLLLCMDRRSTVL